jgi:hypothetical protein
MSAVKNSRGGGGGKFIFVIKEIHEFEGGAIFDKKN